MSAKAIKGTILGTFSREDNDNYDMNGALGDFIFRITLIIFFLFILIFSFEFYIIFTILSGLSSLFAWIIYFASSRQREYLADANAVILTRNPEGLASALETIKKQYEQSTPAQVSELIAPLYIVNPLEAANPNESSLFSTHPPIEKRIQILRTLAKSPTDISYEQVWEQVTGKKIDTKNVSEHITETSSEEINESNPKKSEISRYGNNTVEEKPIYSLICPKCRREYSTMVMFCENDGTPLEKNIKSHVKPIDKKPLPEIEDNEEKKITLKSLTLIIVCALILIIIGTGSYFYYSREWGGNLDKNSDNKVAEESMLKNPIVVRGR